MKDVDIRITRRSNEMGDIIYLTKRVIEIAPLSIVMLNSRLEAA